MDNGYVEGSFMAQGSEPSPNAHKTLTLSQVTEWIESGKLPIAALIAVRSSAQAALDEEEAKLEEAKAALKKPRKPRIVSGE